MTARKLPLYAALLLLTQCSKCKDDVAPLDQLPPATQTGANTFGCLVNGQPWTPQGFDGFANYTVSYDYFYRNGTLNVVASRIAGGNTIHQKVGVNSDSLRSTGIYNVGIKGRHGVGFINREAGCSYYSQDSDTYSKGRFIITRLDLQAGVIAGTFEFTLAKPGCDTIRVTQGRFDKKL